MPYYNKSSTAVALKEIQKELIDLVSNQLKHKEDEKEILLWINETNCYVSCHWHDAEADFTDVSDNYSVVEFDEIQDSDPHELESFYEMILEALNTLPTDSFKNHNTYNIVAYESDEIDEPTKIFELENGDLRIIESTKEDWADSFLENQKELLGEGFKKKKLLLWAARTTIAIILYIFFWKYEWVRWSLLAYVPLNLFSLLSIFFWTNLIRSKLKKIKES